MPEAISGRTGGHSGEVRTGEKTDVAREAGGQTAEVVADRGVRDNEGGVGNNTLENVLGHRGGCEFSPGGRGSWRRILCTRIYSGFIPPVPPALGCSGRGRKQETRQDVPADAGPGLEWRGQESPAALASRVVIW